MLAPGPPLLRRERHKNGAGTALARRWNGDGATLKRRWIGAGTGDGATLKRRGSALFPASDPTRSGVSRSRT